ncbi:MAG: RNA-splicing ligase RtcB [Desulfomicrobiaceae bacterium]|nr:RNA-splicing ligase RtcB [Desulfomicrobiaceae bacterium]HCF05461.1 RNA-splicing ligase RtcB [Desulfomicrobiaceae bacterium]
MGRRRRASQKAVKPRPRKAGSQSWAPHAAPWSAVGRDLDPEAVAQMEAACTLPVAVTGALLPDAHVGYGLPIGGVLAVRGAVIPYGVGMDIACRMRLSVLDYPVAAVEREQERLAGILLQNTRFGVGAHMDPPLAHPVMDRDWGVSPVTRQHKDLAWRQLGTSGAGNHFVEWGVVELADPLGPLAPGRYLGLLSHSGSRGVGGEVARFYSALARSLHPELPGHVAQLAWLDLMSEEGQEYWAAMELMGCYSAANHELIHQRVAAALGTQAVFVVENHHNFAWMEDVGAERLVVHRKGATPARSGVLGVIPGTMIHPAYVVEGLGARQTVCSASHGAGRCLGRKEALRRFSRRQLDDVVRRAGVLLLGGGVDEIPLAYKDIREVMAAQRDVVRIRAMFFPRIVRMA